jgi:hypothetical protein
MFYGNWETGSQTAHWLLTGYELQCTKRANCSYRGRKHNVPSMKKTFPLTLEGKNRDRVVEAVKNDIRKYLARERRKSLPEGVDFWDFDCKFGPTADSAVVAHVAALTDLINAVVAAEGAQLYVELIAKPGVRTAKPATENEHPDGDD